MAFMTSNAIVFKNKKHFVTSHFFLFVYMLTSRVKYRSYVTLFLFIEGASVQSLQVSKEFVINLLASTRVFRKKKVNLFDFCLFLTFFCRRRTYSE